MLLFLVLYPTLRYSTLHYPTLNLNQTNLIVHELPLPGGTPDPSCRRRRKHGARTRRPRSLLRARRRIPYPTLPYPTLSYPTQPHRTLPYPTLPYPTLPYPTQPHCTLPYPTLPYPTLPYATLPYATLRYPKPNLNVQELPLPGGPPNPSRRRRRNHRLRTRRLHTPLGARRRIRGGDIHLLLSG